MHGEPLGAAREAFHWNKYTGSGETVLYGTWRGGGAPAPLLGGVYLAPFVARQLAPSAPRSTSKTLKRFDFHPLPPLFPYALSKRDAVSLSSLGFIHVPRNRASCNKRASQSTGCFAESNLDHTWMECVILSDSCVVFALNSIVFSLEKRGSNPRLEQDFRIANLI